MSQTARYDFYEKVLVNTDDSSYSEINRKVAAVLGRSHSKNGWIYAIHIYENPEEVWDAPEHILVPTGDFDRRETFYDGSSIRISKNGEPLDGR